MAEFFAQVKQAFARDAQGNLQRLGVKLKGKKGEWLTGLCPCGKDTSGSASYTQEGFLNCHQCGRKDDVFEWLAEIRGCSAWAVCQDLAKDFGLSLPVKQTRGARPPSTMGTEILRASIKNLWELDQAEPARLFLSNRKIANPQLLAAFGVGFLNGLITFAQWDNRGGLRPRYRRYSPGGQTKWTWSGGKGGTQGFWPYYTLPKDATVLLLEGEWDVLTAWSVLRLQDQGIFAFTWTGGAGAPIPGHAIPEQWRGNRVEICYDNDTFQGPDWSEHRAPDRHELLPMERRRDNLLNGVAARFVANHCDVYVRAVPIDPLEKFGADLRDWADAGGRDIGELPIYSWSEVKPKQHPIVECTFTEAFQLAEKKKRAKYRAEVGAIDAYGVPIPRFSTLNCDMGRFPPCQDCRAPALFPKRSIDWSEHSRELAVGLAQRNPEAWLLKNLIGRPNRCPRAEIVHEEFQPGSRWIAVQNDPEDSQLTELLVVSQDSPSLSGDVEVTGKLHAANNGYMCMAESVVEIDRPDLDLSFMQNDFKELCAPDATEPEQIDEFLRRRADDLAWNVTKIHGRDNIVIAHDLLAHSTMAIPVDGRVQRGWLDISIIGDTRTGKSVTFRELYKHHGLGTIHSCMENISRAGMTMGATTDKRLGTRLKPGLFPRCHKKMLTLDEFHIMVEKSKENPILNLQSARDDGKVHGVKIYGDRWLPAKVRFCGMGNWFKGRRETFRWPCQHYLALYGAPESVSRLDFGLAIGGDPDPDFVEVPHEWSSELTAGLILRAWSQDESQVRILPNAVALAKDQCEEWRGIYFYDELPLFTPEEKAVSLLRIATAVANVCFSHPADDIYAVETRKVHVEWAIEWLRRTWLDNGYEDYSRIASRRAEIERPFECEALVMLGLKLDNSEDAANVLPMLMTEFNSAEVASILGTDTYDALKWLGKGLRQNLFQSVTAINGWSKAYRLTKGGTQLVRNVLTCAEDYPGEYARRYETIRQWSLHGRTKQPDLIPLNTPGFRVIDEWDERTGASLA